MTQETLLVYYFHDRETASRTGLRIDLATSPKSFMIDAQAAFEQVSLTLTACPSNSLNAPSTRVAC